MIKKITLQDKWDELDSQINKIGEAFLNSYYDNDERPVVIYQLEWYKTIRELTVTGFSVWKAGRPFLYGKKATKKDVASLETFLNNFTPAIDDIRISWKHENSSSAIKVTDLNDKNYSIVKENLFPYQNELRERYEPREGHVACGYCHKQFPESQKVHHTIIGRSRDAFGRACVTQEPMVFCSGQCAGNEQMAREG